MVTFSRESGLLEEETAILIGVSGGPDSTVLLHIFLTLREKYALRLAVAHMNYGLRGKDSAADETFVRNLCERYDVPFFTLHPKTKSSDEARLRDLRYNFFDTLAEKHGFDRIAVAHTRDDQAETVLLRLLRGAGLDGLSAMRPIRGRIIRPLLKTSRADIMAYLKKEGLPFRTDRSNTDTTYLRNRVRHLLIPYLEKRFQPNIREILARTASIIAAEQDASPAEIPSTGPATGNDTVRFDRDRFLALPLTRQRRFLRESWESLLPEIPAPGLSVIGECLKLIRSGKSKHREAAFGGLKVEAKGDSITLIRLKNKR